MREGFNKVCDFCRAYPSDILGGLPTGDSRVADVKKTLTGLVSELQAFCDTFSPVPLKVDHAKGAGAFPRIPYIVILPPGQKTNDGVYVSICFGKEGAGAVAGFAQSVEHPRPGFSKVVRGASAIDVAQFNTSYANPLEILRSDFSEEKLIAHLKESITLCLTYLGDSPLQKMVATFRSEFPDFKTFSASGQEYQKNEDTYKRKAVFLFEESFLPWLHEAPESMPDRDFAIRLHKFYQKTNLINHFLVSSVKEKILDSAELMPAFKLHCHQLLSKAITGKKLDSELDEMIGFLRDGGKLQPGLVKQIPTYLLMFANPAEHIYIGPTHIEKFFSALGYTDFDSTVKFTAEQYAKALSYFKKLKSDLAELKPRDFIDLQSFYFVAINYIEGEEKSDVKKPDIFSVSKLVDACRRDVSGCKICLADSFLPRFISALAAKPFTILTGLSGSGKSMLAQAFTHWLVAEEQRRFVPVGADWTNNEHLLGYANALDKKEYVMPDTGVLTLLLDANTNPTKPFFLVLDEMNLSHVERYFADFLSAMESGEKIQLYKGEQRTANKRSIPGEVLWPENLFIIGTVNIDETTYMFSPKVLDRAQVIEFRVSPEEMSAFLGTATSKIELKALDGKGAKYAEVFLAQAQNKEINIPEGAVDKLKVFFGPLAEVGAEFGYRTANEFLRFVGQYKEFAGETELDKVVDFAVMQKLLPKLHGSTTTLGPVITKLLELCAGYPVSKEKLERMQKRLVANGFTSYAEA